MRIFILFSGEYGKRHIQNIRQYGPDSWEIETWQAPSILPPVIDYPEDYLPEHLPPTDLILSFAKINVVFVTPKPLCSLTEHDYGIILKERITYDSPQISEFAHHFGQPDLQITVDPQTGLITETAVIRDAVCGCARFVAEQLVGVSVNEAEEKSPLSLSGQYAKRP